MISMAPRQGVDWDDPILLDRAGLRERSQVPFGK